MEKPVGARFFCYQPRMIRAHVPGMQGLSTGIKISYGKFSVRTRYGHKKVVRCINNVSVEVVYLRAEHSENKCFLPCYATDKGKS